MCDDRLGLEVACSSSCSAVVNNNHVRPGHLVHHTDRLELRSHHHWPLFSSQNMTNLVDFSVSLWLPHNNDFCPASSSMMTKTIITGGEAGDDVDGEAIQEEGPDTPHGVVVTIRLVTGHTTAHRQHLPSVITR